MLFGGWDVLGETLVVGVLVYLAVVLMLRVSGKRTLSKMNAFDFVVTIALGSILATTMLSSDVTLAQGLLAFFILIGLQFVMTLISTRSKAFSRLIKSEPSLLYYQGQFLASAMKRERVVEEEILTAMRQQGIHNIHDVDGVVLETDGNFSVIDSGDAPADSGILANMRPPQTRSG